MDVIDPYYLLFILYINLFHFFLQQVPGQLGLLSFEGNQFQGMEPIAEKMKVSLRYSLRWSIE